MVVALYITETPKITIEHGIACVRAKSHDEVLCWNLPLHEFRAAVELAKYLLYNHDNPPKNVTPIRAH